MTEITDEAREHDDFDLGEIGATTANLSRALVQRDAEIDRLRREIDMHQRIRLDVEKVLDDVLGTEEEDGAGAGLEGDVRLLADRCKRAESQLAAIRRGEPAGSVQWAVAYGGDDPNECAGVLEYDDRAEAEEQLQWTVGGFLASRTVTSTPWRRVDAEVPDAQ
jgi:hypothetical protein